MSGTKAGARKIADKILARDPNFYKKIGKIGGENSEGTWLRDHPDEARRIGRMGGLKSRRGKALTSNPKRNNISV